MKTLFTRASVCWNILLGKKKENLILMGIELLFFLLYGFLASFFIKSIRVNLVYVGDAISQASQDVNFVMSDIIFSSPEFHRIVLLSLGLGLITYFLYGFFYSRLWTASLKQAGVKVESSYTKRFFLVNIVWFILFSVYVLVDFFLSYVDTVGERLNPIGFIGLSELSLILLVFVLYFATISYVLISSGKRGHVQKSFGLGFKKIKILGLNFLFLLLCLLAIHFMLIVLAFGHQALMVIGGLCLVFPFLSLSRLMIVKAVDEL